MGTLCAALTGRGNACLNPAKDGPFCPGHNPANWCGQPTRDGGRCRRTRSYGTDRCSKHQR